MQAYTKQRRLRKIQIWSKIMDVWRLLTCWLCTKTHTRAHVVAKVFSVVIPRPRKQCINCTINKVTDQGGSVHCVYSTYIW